MKKKYMKPVMESEMFVANEYVAACSSYTYTYSGVDGLSCEECDDPPNCPVKILKIYYPDGKYPSKYDSEIRSLEEITELLKNAPEYTKIDPVVNIQITSDEIREDTLWMYVNFGQTLGGLWHEVNYASIKQDSAVSNVS